MTGAGPIERALARERVIVAGALGVLVTLAWLYLLTGAGTGMSTRAMTTWQFPPPLPAMFGPAQWDVAYAVVMVVMWWVMMIAMMVPSAAPMILLYSRMKTRAAARGRSLAAFGDTSIFLLGYLIPTAFDQNRWAQSRSPMDMIFHGWSMSLFQASQLRATISA